MVELFSGAPDMDALELRGICKRGDCLPLENVDGKEERKNRSNANFEWQSPCISHGFSEHWKVARLELSRWDVRGYAV